MKKLKKRKKLSVKGSNFETVFARKFLKLKKRVFHQKSFCLFFCGAATFGQTKEVRRFMSAKFFNAEFFANSVAPHEAQNCSAMNLFLINQVH